MPPENTEGTTVVTEVTQPNTPALSIDSPEVKALIAEELKSIKAKLDTAYAARDAAAADAAALKKAAADAEAARLDKEGKTQEAANVRIQQLLDEKAALDKTNQDLINRNTELTRDVTIEGMLSTVTFKTAKAKNAAARDIRDELVRNEKGEWLGKNGSALSVVISEYVKDPENAYLLKAPVNNGSGTQQLGTGTAASGGKDKKLFERTQAEVIQMAIEGKLPNK